MPTCANHPERETRFRCGKHEIYQCEACLECRDPELYCKYRSSCPIWFMTRKRKHLADSEPSATTSGDHQAAGAADPSAG